MQLREVQWVWCMLLQAPRGRRGDEEADQLSGVLVGDGSLEDVEEELRLGGSRDLTARTVGPL